MEYKDGLPVFYLKLRDDKEQQGTSAIAFVDEPAMESMFVKFSKENKEAFVSFSNIDHSRRIVTGAVLIPEKYIFRKAIPEHNIPNHYVKLTGDEIEKIQLKFMAEKNTDKAKIFHESKDTIDGVVFFEHIMVDSKRGIKAPEYLGELPDKTWVMSSKINNDELWKKVQSGEVNGYSIEALLSMVERVDFSKQEEPTVIDELKKILK